MREIVRWASSTVWSGKVLQCDLRKASVRVLRHLVNPVDDCSDRLLEKAGLPWCQLLSTPRSFLTSQIDFQSSPGRRIGCNIMPPSIRPCYPACFNPHPVVGPDATRSSVSTLLGLMVSILTRSSDRMQLGLPVPAAMLPMFQSSPGRRTGCNSSSRATLMGDPFVFQSSPGHLTGCNTRPRTWTVSRYRCFNPHPVV